MYYFLFPQTAQVQAQDHKTKPKLIDNNIGA